jgi:1-acyl-sn-glycerol-3-phosphate acyltransferase
MVFVRSFLFNLAFYAVSAIMMIGALPLLALGSRRANRSAMLLWTRVVLFLLRTLAGTRWEVRGLDNIPPGGAILAAKHQSAFETFALFPYVDGLTVVMKRQLMFIPLFGWYANKTGMIAIERKRGSATLRALVGQVREAMARGWRILFFPEGTRRTPGAEPAYQVGVAHLYRALNTAVVPVAHNSGLYWPRRKFLHYPGVVIVEFLPPIAAGMPPREFLKALEIAIETASDRLLVEAWRATPRPPFPPSAAAKVDLLAGA